MEHAEKERKRANPERRGQRSDVFCSLEGKRHAHGKRGLSCLSAWKKGEEAHPGYRLRPSMAI